MQKSGVTLAVIEKQLGPGFDIALPIADKQLISDFILHVGSSFEEISGDLAGSRHGSIPLTEETAPRFIQELLASRVRMTLIAPLAIYSLVTGLSRLDDVGVLPNSLLGVLGRIAVLNTALRRTNWLREPFSRPALRAYTQFSPIIGFALRWLERSDVGRMAKAPWDIRALYDRDVPPDFPPAEGKGFFVERPATLTSLLPQTSN